MGFIMGKGRGTDEILKMLHQVFVTDVAATAKKLADFAPRGKDLEGLVADLKILPTDPGDRAKWIKWLRDIKAAGSAHDEIKKHLKKSLGENPPVPIYCNWIEDNYVIKPHIDFTEIGNPVGRAELSILTVITPNYRHLPFKKKVAAVRKLAKKKPGKKKAAKKKKS